MRAKEDEMLDTSEKLLKVKACEHKERRLLLGTGEDAPGNSKDDVYLCNTCGAGIHEYAHGGGLTSPNYPMVYESPLLKPFLAVCQQLIDAEREVKKLRALSSENAG